jgi:4a-hydroxytetrahydrobiopterin dehydratase
MTLTITISTAYFADLDKPSIPRATLAYYHSRTEVHMSLAEKKCMPCRGGTPPLTPTQYEPLLKQLNDWEIIGGHHLSKTFLFENFAQSMALATRIAEIAEQQNHHPDLLVRWGELRVEIWTHAADGLTESDFILAAKIDRVA